MSPQGNGRLIVIGGTTSIFDRAKNMGIGVLHIQKPELFDRAVIPFVERVILTDYETDNTLLSTLKTMHSIIPFDACVTFTENAMLTTARVNQALQLPGHDVSLVSLTIDKYAMRRKLNAHGFSYVRSAIGSSAEDVLSFGRSYGYPLVIKPRDGVGSMGVQYIENKDGVCGLDFSSEILIEEYLNGPEFSVEAFSFSGQHVIFAVTEKTTFPVNHESQFVELAHRVPAAITSEEKQKIDEVVREFLHILQVQDGPTHTEIKLTSNGPRIVETHTRPGGDFIPELVQLSIGYDLYSMALGWPCGLVKPVVEQVLPMGGAAIHFFVPLRGKLEAVFGVEEVRTIRGIVRVHIGAQPGTHIPTVKRSSDRVGYVIAIADSASEASSLCEEVTKRVQFVVS